MLNFDCRILKVVLQEMVGGDMNMHVETVSKDYRIYM